MLEKLFGNIVIEKILFFLLENDRGYPSQISKQLDIQLYSVQKALDRLEKGGILVSFLEGKIRMYHFNPRYPFLAELKTFLQKAYQSIPDQYRGKYYGSDVRKRPRRRGKPLNLLSKQKKISI